MLLPYILIILIVVRVSLVYYAILSLTSILKMSFSEEQSGLETQNATANQTRIDHYRVPKIPQFFKEDTDLWFVQVEASLRSAQITSDNTKADIVIAALDFEVITSIKDLITSLPRPADLFSRIKKRIIAIFGASPESNLRKLLKGQVITIGKPSLILNRLRGLDDGKCDESIIKSIFLDHLPAHTRIILAASAIDDLNRLADVADKIADNSAPPDAVMAASSRPGENSGTMFAELSDQIKKLTVTTESLSKRLRRMEQSHGSRGDRSQSRSSRNRSKSNDNNKEKLCWAHRKYPKDPRSCRNWCSKFSTWKSENQSDPLSGSRAKGDE